MRHAYCVPDGGCQEASYAVTAPAEAAAAMLPPVSCTEDAAVCDATLAAGLGAALSAGRRKDRPGTEAPGSAASRAVSAAV